MYLKCHISNLIHWKHTEKQIFVGLKVCQVEAQINADIEGFT